MLLSVGTLRQVVKQDLPTTPPPKRSTLGSNMRWPPDFFSDWGY
jgi:hypothetical protein